MTHFRENTSLWNDLTDEQSEKLVGGVGIGPNPPGSAGVAGWFGGPQVTGEQQGLFNAGFTPGDSITAGPNNIIVPGPKDAV